MLGLPASTNSAVLFVWIAGYSRHLSEGGHIGLARIYQIQEYGDLSVSSRRPILIVALQGVAKSYLP